MAGNLEYSEASLETLHDHVLLDIKIVGTQIEAKDGVATDGAEAVEHVSQPDVPAVVDGHRDQPAAHVDLLPTFVEIAGKKTLPKQPLDGVSLVKLWKNPEMKLDRAPIYLHFPGYLEAGKKGWRTTPAA